MREEGGETGFAPRPGDGDRRGEKQTPPPDVRLLSSLFSLLVSRPSRRRMEPERKGSRRPGRRTGLACIKAAGNPDSEVLTLFFLNLDFFAQSPKVFLRQKLETKGPRIPRSPPSSISRLKNRFQTFFMRSLAHAQWSIKEVVND